MPRLPGKARATRGRAGQGTPDLDTQETTRGRGAPSLVPDRCVASGACARVCPTAAISLDPEGAGRYVWRLDYGACTLCGMCVEACEPRAILDSAETRLAALDRDDLVAEHRVLARPLARPPAPGESYRRGRGG